MVGAPIILTVVLAQRAVYWGNVYNELFTITPCSETFDDTPHSRTRVEGYLLEDRLSFLWARGSKPRRGLSVLSSFAEVSRSHGQMPYRMRLLDTSASPQVD